MFHPEITRQLGQLREATFLDQAARERAIYAAPVTGHKVAECRLALALLVVGILLLAYVAR